MEQGMFGQISKRRLISSLAFALMLVVAAVQSASANADAEKFAQSVIDRGLLILRDNSAGDQARREKFHEFILPLVNARKTALFTLGIYRRGASDAVIDPFVAAFTDYSTAIYETRLDEYKNATVSVTGSIDNKPGDVTVDALARAENLREPVRIAFRLLGSGGNYKIVDIQVAGIWLSIDQRDQFASQLGKNNGDIPALTSSLIERTARIRANPQTS
jgi:phospholipid transport system substrate-binding protein